MSKPDLRIYGALVLAGMLDLATAQRIVDSYGDSPDYDNPVPMDVESACSVLANRMDEREDEEILASILNMRVDGTEPEPDVDDDDEFDEDDVDGAIALWNGFKILMMKTLRD